MTTVAVFAGVLVGLLLYLGARVVMLGFYTIAPDERAVLTSFGRAHRDGDATILDHPIAESLDPSERERFAFPRLKVIGPGGPYFRWPWQKVHKVCVAVRTANIAWDPEFPEANHNGTLLDAVTHDQLNTGISGQIRFNICEHNLYAPIFGVKNPTAHVMGYFVSVLRERVANFRAPETGAAIEGAGEREEAVGGPRFEGISINDLRKNLNLINDQMDEQCRSSAARYGIALEASLITGIDPPEQIESALAAINTAHNEVSSDISVARALADQRIVESRRAVEIQTMNAEAEVEPLRRLGEQLTTLKAGGADALPGYLRSVRLELFQRAKHIFLPAR